MTDSDKKEKVASALLDLTRREALTWEKFEAGTEELPEDLGSGASPVYVAPHEGMVLYLYREGEGEEGGDAEPAHAILEVADPERGARWAFPELEAVENLYNLADFRASGLNSWMDEIIKEAEERLEVGGDDVSEEVPEEPPTEENVPNGETYEGDEPGEEEIAKIDEEESAEDAVEQDADGEKSTSDEGDIPDENSEIGEPQEEDVFGAGGGDFGSEEGGMEEDRII